MGNPMLFLPVLAILLSIPAGSPTAPATPQKSSRANTKIVRYVRIELPGNNRTLSLAEVQVWREGRNIAPDGVASQSSTDAQAPAGRANDGNPSGTIHDASVCLTAPGENPWWELDLGRAQGVQRITIWNRQDGQEGKLDNFTLKLLGRRREVVLERKGLRAPRPRVDYLATGESVIAAEPILEVEVSTERLQHLQPAINTAIQQGVRYLKDTQLRDGSWADHTPSYRAGQTALSVYALVKSGLPRTDPSVRMGLRYLRENPPVKTYSIGVTMMLYETLADEGLRRPMQELLDRLIETQIRGKGTNAGMWGYPDNCDLSNTQYAALGLYAAWRAGLKVPTETFENLLEGTLRFQDVPQIIAVDGDIGRSTTGQLRMAGFTYRANQSNSTLSMTTAGVSVLAICQKVLEERGSARSKAECSVGMRMGMEYLHRKFKVEGTGKWNLYYLYGLERVGAFLGLDRIGGKNWYWEGSDVLVRQQGEHGKWNQPTDTSFALLFLSKATARGASTGPMLTLPDDLRISEGPDVDIRWLAKGSRSVTMWITGFHEDLISDYAWEGAEPGLRIRRVDYLCDGEVIKSIPVDSTVPWKGERFPTKYEVPGPGTYRMEVLVCFSDPLAEGGENSDAEMMSMPLEVFVRDEFTPTAIEASAKPKPRNFLAGKGVTAECSSKLNDKQGVALLWDGAQGTNWLSAKDDEQPTLTFRFDKPVRANKLVLSNANSSILSTSNYDRATRIEVGINNQRKPKYVEITKGVYDSWVLDFKTTRVRSLEIRILEREPGSAQPGVVGFGEVELYFER